MASVYDRQMAKTEEAGLRQWRADLLADVTGEVLEIGAGTGLNLAHYPSGVTRLVLAEPDRFMRAKLAERTASSDLPIEVVDAGVDPLTFGDESFDVVVSTLVLCSVPDEVAALGEIHRVLRPGGRFVHLEHVAAIENPKRHKWQRRIEPVWRRLVGNCHLTRTTDQAITEAGFELDEVRRESMRQSPPWVRVTTRGVAIKPTTS
jgi:ubiquinone/menaquinone biosynthesis C-methylase UbiE